MHTTAVSSSILFDSSAFVDVIFISKKHNVINYKTFSFEELVRLSENSDSGFNIKYFKKASTSEEVTFVLRFRDSAVSGFIPRKVKLANGEEKVVDIKFTPKSMSALNIKGASSEDRRKDDSYPLHLVDCRNGNYDVSDLAVFDSNIEAINFLSVGFHQALSRYNENRIYGDLSFVNLLKEDIKGIRLIVKSKSEENRILSTEISELTKCMLQEFDDFSAKEEVAFKAELNLAKPLFSFHSLQLLLFPALEGSKVEMYVEAEIFTEGGKIEKIESDHFSLTSLVTPDITQEQIFTREEDYDRSDEGIVRTGGDKWILPAYSQMIADITTNASFEGTQWQIGDLSKLNGGTFKTHSEHTDGRDADISFNARHTEDDHLEFHFNTPDQVTPEQKRSFLMRFEKLLKTSLYNWRFIEQIYLTRQQGAIDVSKWLNTRLANRCYENERVIQFESPKARGSLITAAAKHLDHAHIKFNPVDKLTGKPEEFLTAVKPTEDLDNFIFELNSSGKLTITPISASFTSKKFIAWRFQNIDGYDDFNMDLDLGPRKVNPDEKNQSAQFTKTGMIPKSFIKLTIAYKRTGACVQRNIQIDPGIASKMKRWTYERKDKNRWNMVRI